MYTLVTDEITAETNLIEVIIDSGATCNMFARSSLFKSMTLFAEHEKVPIRVADGKMIFAEGIGYGYLDELTWALYVPSLSVSLISVSQLQRCKVTFLDERATICSRNGELILSASVRNHLYGLTRTTCACWSMRM